MKKEPCAVRKKWVTVRMNEEELQLLEKFRKKTTEKTNSNYLRKLGLNEPVRVMVRNASLDGFLLEIIRMRKEIHYIGHNFNQAVHKLHLLEKIPEFRHWINEWEQTQKLIALEIQKTTNIIAKFTEQWSQE